MIIMLTLRQTHFYVPIVKLNKIVCVLYDMSVIAMWILHPGRDKRFLSCPNVQSGSDAHPASYSVGAVGPLLEDTATGA